MGISSARPAARRVVRARIGRLSFDEVVSIVLVHGIDHAARHGFSRVRPQPVTVRERLTAQLLAGEPARDAVGVVERLLAVQAQDPRGFRLAIRVRTRSLHAREVEAALADRALVVATLNRGTLHLVRSADYEWLRTLVAPTLRRTSDTRLNQEGVTPAKLRRALTLLERQLDDGPA